ncbi:MAG TPA: hypothetical protein VF282_08630 [Bacillota bacterium]
MGSGPTAWRRLAVGAGRRLAGWVLLALASAWLPAAAHAHSGEATGEVRTVPLEPAGRVTASTFGISAEPAGSMQVERIGPLEIWRLPGTGIGPFDLAVDGRTLWLTLFAAEGTGEVGVGRVDLDAGTFSRIRLPEGIIPYTLRLAPDGRLWVADYEFSAEPRQRHVLRLDPAAGEGVAYPLPGPADGITDFAFTPDGSVWLADYAAGGLLRLDPSRQAMDRLPTPVPEDGGERTAFTGAFRLAVDPEGHLWAVESIWDRLTRIHLGQDRDRVGLELLALPQGIDSPVEIVIDGDTVWTTEHPGSRLLRWRPGDGGSTVIHLWPTTDEGYPVAGPNDLIAGPDGSVWAVVHFVGRLARVLPGGETVNEFFLPPALGLPATRVLPLWGDVDDQGAVWAAAYGADALVRLGPDVPVAQVEIDETDLEAQAGGAPATVRMRLTFSGTWPEDWRVLAPALVGEDLPEGVTVEAEPRQITARPGESVDVTLTVTAGREAAAGDYPVVAGARNTLVAAHRTLTLHVDPARPLTATVALTLGVTALWALALVTALTASRGDTPRDPE